MEQSSARGKACHSSIGQQRCTYNGSPLRCHSPEKLHTVQHVHGIAFGLCAARPFGRSWSRVGIAALWLLEFCDLGFAVVQARLSLGAQRLARQFFEQLFHVVPHVLHPHDLALRRGVDGTYGFGVCESQAAECRQTDADTHPAILGRSGVGDICRDCF